VNGKAKALGAAGGVAALLMAGIEIWDRIEAKRIAHVAADNRSAFECEVRLCEAQGGRWWRGDCLPGRR